MAFCFSFSSGVSVWPPSGYRSTPGIGNCAEATPVSSVTIAAAPAAFLNEFQIRMRIIMPVGRFDSNYRLSFL